MKISEKHKEEREQVRALRKAEREAKLALKSVNYEVTFFGSLVLAAEAHRRLDVKERKRQLLRAARVARNMGYEKELHLSILSGFEFDLGCR